MRVLIVDPHPVTRDGLRAALAAAGIEVVGEASTGEGAIGVVARCSPDIVTMAVGLEGMDGIEATHALHAACPDAKVIVFTRDESRETISAAMRAGVSGYMLKDSTAEEIVDALRTVMEGKAILHPKVTQVFMEEARLASKTAAAPALSPREIEVLQKVAHGATTKNVAEELGLSPHTVKTHLERIFEKLGANDRAGAVAIAMRRGLVD